MLDRFNVSLGRWLGIPVTLHWSWVLFFLILLFQNPAFALILCGVFFLVLLHELGHCLAARYFLAPVHGITLYPIGGMANIQIPWKPTPELVTALAGPAVNVVLMPVLIGLGQSYEFFANLVYYNIVLLVFNLIPAFPMDGGRVLRALLTYMLKDYYKATLIAARVGQGVCGLFAVIGLIYGHIMLVVIAIFIAMAAKGELHMARVRSMEGEATPSDLLSSAELMADVQRKLDNLR